MMLKIVRTLLIILGWTFLVSAASRQTAGGPGYPPQTQLYRDAAFLARAIPFIIAVGIVIGIYQARAAARGGGDAIHGDAVQRHDSGVVITHWYNAAGLIISLVTGAIVLRWVSRPPEVRIIFVIHYIGAAMILFAVSNHLARHGVSGGTGLLPKSFSVIRDVIGEMLGYLGLFGPEEAALRIPWPKVIRQPLARYTKALLGYKESRVGKYLATEKLISYTPWAILIGVIVTTGLIKVLRYVYAIPASLVATASAVHDVTAALIALMLVMHVLPLLLVPANWPLLMSIFRTTVPVEYVRKRHPAWFKELSSGQAAAKTASAAAPEKAKGTVETSSAD